jgi:hypothetical protein
VCPLLHGFDLGPARQIVIVAEVDVSRTAEGREAEAEATDPQAGPAQTVEALFLR